MTSNSSEPYGTTPLPTSSAGSPVHVKIDTETIFHNDNLQQPQTQHMIKLDANSPTEDSAASLLANNEHFTVYAVKSGLIRVLHKHSTMRALLRLHKHQLVSDIQFFPNGDILATVAHDVETGSSSVIVWRLYEKASEVCTDVLVEVRNHSCIVSRVVWHPFNANQFWMIHDAATSTTTGRQTIATLVETTRIETVPHESQSHSVCHVPAEDGVIVAGAIQLVASNEASLTDLVWSSQQSKHVLSTFDNGDIVLWDLKQLVNHAHGVSRAVTPSRLGTVHENGPISQCVLLPHDCAMTQASSSCENNWTPCFVTGTYKNRVLTLWSAFGPNALPTKLQVVSLEQQSLPSSSYLLSACFQPSPTTASPPACFLVLADRSVGQILAIHCKSEWSEQNGISKRPLLIGCDYVVPFKTVHPTYAWSVETVPTTDISEEELSEQGSLVFDVKMICYQSTAVQALTLTSYMCLPPEHSYTDPTNGITAERLMQDAVSTHVSDIGLESDDDDLMYDEQYDIADDEFGNNNSMDDDDEYEAPDASALPPPPEGFSNGQPAAASPLVSNPFANWLGSIATSVKAPMASTAEPIPSFQPPETAPPSTPPTLPPGLLSPMDIIKGSAATSTTQPTSKTPHAHKVRDVTPTTSNAKGRKKPPKSDQSQPQILQREEEAAAAAAARPLADAPNNAVKERSLAAAKSDVDSSLSNNLRQAIRDEIEATMMPQLQSMLETSLKTIVVSDLRAAIGRIKIDTGSISSAVSQNIESSMQTAFADSVRTVMIPTLESVSNQVLAKVSDHLEKAEVATKTETARDMDAITKQLGAMTQLVVKLTEEVHSLREAVASQQGQQQKLGTPVATAKAPADGSAEKFKHDILALLKTKNYAEAFTLAVSASTAEIALFCCANADVNDVLGGSTPVLSQMVLLCLAQQLGTIVGAPVAPIASVQLSLEWLQEIALSLNPRDTAIASHVPNVLQQLVAGINKRMAQNDPVLRRPLQRLLQVIRGMQMS
ncbi:hypothetical protein MPSEU_000143100 [Mayamaea pseudoterrestris]|nr:hypothetical protein MPSEU_000143100 [Mayamaea pseudoterrestris]